MTTNAVTFGQDLLMSAKLSASRHPKIGMAWHPWGHQDQEPAPLFIINCQTHMEDIKWSGGN
jgi:hypothetical protein